MTTRSKKALGGSALGILALLFVGLVILSNGLLRGWRLDLTENQLYTVGFSFKPIPNVVIKGDYRNRVADSGSLSDELNLGVGYVF